jgi:2-polyprenyl-6-methoxyphenol hydroxylase-like FAD-dependent oxidoreductase
MNTSKVLIVGAGPTGLALALQLALFKVPFKIIDKETGPGSSSRAMTVMPRVLEQYHGLGIAEKMISDGIKLDGGNLWIDGEKKAYLNIGSFGKGQSVFPYILTYPQDEHESLLVHELKAKNQQVFWETECVSFEQGKSGVEVELKSREGATKETFSYVIGCDGASSIVRKELGLSFEGGTYDELFYVMDAQLENERFRTQEVHFHFFDEVLALFFPLRNKETMRVIGMFPPELSENKKTDPESLLPILEEAFDIQLSEMEWFSTYTVHHRLAEKFRVNRIFLAGDAAHIHSPVGGQGMNAGIGDALNLGWKLALVIQQQADESLLNTYEEERKGFAEQLVATTDRMFKVVSSTGSVSKMLRKRVLPFLVESTLNQSQAMRARYFKMLTQIQLDYQESTLSEGKIGKLHAGMRTPYTSYQEELLKEKSFQLITFGKLENELRQYAETNGIKVKEYMWNEEVKAAGYKESAIYLIRPDDHIAWMSTTQDVGHLERYLEKHGMVSDSVSN